MRALDKKNARNIVWAALRHPGSHWVTRIVLHHAEHPGTSGKAHSGCGKKTGNVNRSGPEIL